MPDETTLTDDEIGTTWATDEQAGRATADADGDDMDADTDDTDADADEDDA